MPFRKTLVTVLAFLTVNPALAKEPVYWKKVDYIDQEEGKGKKYDARLILDIENRVLTVADEDHPKRATYCRIPYDAITSISYSRSKHPRWKSGAGAAVAVGVFAIPIFFMKGKKHWLTITFEGVPEYPEGFLYLRLDKNNYRQIIAGLEGQTGREVEEIVEE